MGLGLQRVEGRRMGKKKEEEEEEEQPRETYIQMYLSIDQSITP